MTKIISIISTNNRGVDLLEAGRFRDAMLEFKKGIAMVTMSCRRSLPNKSFFAFLGSVEWSSDLSRQETLSLICPFIYARAMRISEGDVVSKVAVGALTYNFALTSHLRFFETGDKRCELIHATMKMYNSAYALLQGSPLCLAVLNNMRQIHLYLNHKQASNDFRDQIEKLIDMLHAHFAMENKELFAEVWMNLVTQDASLAPAA